VFCGKGVLNKRFSIYDTVPKIPWYMLRCHDQCDKSRTMTPWPPIKRPQSLDGWLIFSRGPINVDAVLSHGMDEKVRL
jgi:hypothetical protein